MEERGEDILTTVSFCPTPQRPRILLGIPGYLAWLSWPCRCFSSTKYLSMSLSQQSVPATTDLGWPHLHSTFNTSSILGFLMAARIAVYVWPLAFGLAPNCCLTLSSCLLFSLPPERNFLALSWSLLILFQVTKSSRSLYTAWLPLFRRPLWFF